VQTPKRKLVRTLRDESGQSLIIMLLCMSLLLGMVGLAVDVGSLLYQKRLLQTAADAAAVGAATEIPYADWASAGAADATINGVTAGTVSTANGSIVTTVNVNNPPLYGPHTSNTNYAEAIVTQTEPVYFMRLFGRSSVKVTARAVAELENNPGCIYTLDPSLANSLYLNGLGLFLDAPQCAIYVNSSNVNALSASFLDSITAKSIGIVGNYNSGFFSSITPRPVTGIVPVSDPLQYVNPPATSGCLPSHTNLGSAANPLTNGTTLTPGNYCGTFTGGVAHPAIAINNLTGITFSPGTYIINGGGSTNAAALGAGGLAVTGFVGVTGNGVTLYFYNGATFYINTTASLGGFGLRFQAPGPASGAFPGILFFQDRADTSQATLGGTFSILDIEGAVYVPAGKLVYPTTVAATFSNYAIYVAKNIEFQGFLGALVDYAKAASSGGVSPIKGVALVE
jgi:Flp pilus assembly protein TadG